MVRLGSLLIKLVLIRSWSEKLKYCWPWSGSVRGPDNLVPGSLNKTFIHTMMAVMLNCELHECETRVVLHDFIIVTMILALKLVLPHFIVNI